MDDLYQIQLKELNDRLNEQLNKLMMNDQFLDELLWSPIDWIMNEKINIEENLDDIEKDIQKTNDNLTIDFSNLTIEENNKEMNNINSEENENVENKTIISEIEEESNNLSSIDSVDIENKKDIQEQNNIELNKENPIDEQIQTESLEEIEIKLEEIEDLIENKANIEENQEIIEEIVNIERKEQIEMESIEEIEINKEESIENMEDKDIEEIYENEINQKNIEVSNEEIETKMEELIENKENEDIQRDLEEIGKTNILESENDNLGNENIYQNDPQSDENDNNTLQTEYSHLLNDFPQHLFHPHQDNNNILAFPVFYEKNGYHNQNVAQLSNPLIYTNDSKSFLMDGFLKQEDDSLYLPKNEIPPLKQNLFTHFSQMDNSISEKNADFSEQEDKNVNLIDGSNSTPPPMEKIPALNLPSFEQFVSPPKSPRYSFAKNEKGELLYDFDPNKKKRERRSLTKDPLKKLPNDKLLPIPLIQTPDGSPVEKAEVSFINRIRVGHNRKLQEKEKKKKEPNKHFPNQLTEPEPFQLGRRDNLSVSFPQPLIPNHQVFPNYPLRDIVEKKKIEISKKLNKSQI